MITHTISGKVYFIAWSMDVEIEGQNVVRHLDMTTSNHASPMANGPTPIPGLDKMDPAVKKDCDASYQKYGLSRYGSNKCNGDTHQSHHPAQNACFVANRLAGTAIAAAPNYSELDAPGICLEGGSHDSGSPHDICNKAQSDWAKRLRNAEPRKKPTYKELRAESKQQLQDAGLSEKEAECVMKAVDSYMTHIGVNENTPLRIPRVSE